MSDSGFGAKSIKVTLVPLGRTFSDSHLNLLTAFRVMMSPTAMPASAGSSLPAGSSMLSMETSNSAYSGRLTSAAGIPAPDSSKIYFS